LTAFMEMSWWSLWNILTSLWKYLGNCYRNILTFSRKYLDNRYGNNWRSLRKYLGNR
jgi:hypothetical protein